MTFEKRELGTPPEFIGSAAGGAKASKRELCCLIDACNFESVCCLRPNCVLGKVIWSRRGWIVTSILLTKGFIIDSNYEISLVPLGSTWWLFFMWNVICCGNVLLCCILQLDINIMLFDSFAASGPLKSDFEVVDGLAKYTGNYKDDNYINTIEKQHERAKDFMKWEGRMRYLRTHLIRCYREVCICV